MQRAASSGDVGGFHAIATGMYHQWADAGAASPPATRGEGGRVHNTTSLVIFQHQHQVDVTPLKPSTSKANSRAKVKVPTQQHQVGVTPFKHSTSKANPQAKVKVPTQQHQVGVTPFKHSTSKANPQAKVKVPTQQHQVDVTPFKHSTSKAQSRAKVKVPTQQHQVDVIPLKHSTSKAHSRAKVKVPTQQHQVDVIPLKHSTSRLPHSRAKVKVPTQHHQVDVTPLKTSTSKAKIYTQHKVMSTHHEQEALPKPLPRADPVQVVINFSCAALATEFKSNIAGTDTPGFRHSYPIVGPILAPPSPSFSSLGPALPYRPNAIITNPPDRVVRSQQGMIPPPPARGESFPTGDMLLPLKKAEFVVGEGVSVNLHDNEVMSSHGDGGVSKETGSKVIDDGIDDGEDATKFTSSLLHNDTATFSTSSRDVPIEVTPTLTPPTTSLTTLENIPDDLASKNLDELEHTVAWMDSALQLGDMSEVEQEHVALDTQDSMTSSPGESLSTGLY